MQYKDCIIGSGFEHEENVILKKSVLGMLTNFYYIITLSYIS